MAGNSGGPWGSGGNNGGDNGGNRGDEDRNRDPRGQDNGQITDIDDLVKKGQEQLRVLMGGKGGSGGTDSGGASGGPSSRGIFMIVGILAVAFWIFKSVYTVGPEQRSVELFLGEYSETGQPGLNFAPWPVVTHELVAFTTRRTVDIGKNTGTINAGLMLTGDENVVDIDFQVVWNVRDPAKFLFNLADPDTTIAAVAESAMREIVAQSNLAPILNRDRGAITDRLEILIQKTLDDYDSGMNVVVVNFDKADPPNDVIDAFRDVQAAEQERDQLRNKADAYSNEVLAQARGRSAQLLELAEGYRAQVVNSAEGEASRFLAVLEEYEKAPEVTRKRLYLEAMERVLGNVDKIILDENAGGGQGVVPYLPLNELRRTQTGGN